MSYPFDITQHTLRSTKEGLRIVPLRSSTNVKERVSTDTNQRCIKKVTTVTTSRHAGQRVVSKNTQTTTTDTNTHGVVVLGQPGQLNLTSPPPPAPYVTDIKNVDTQKVCNAIDDKASFLPTSKSRGNPELFEKHGKYQSDKQYKEIEEVYKKRIVGTLASMFECKEDFRRPAPKETKTSKKLNIAGRAESYISHETKPKRDSNKNIENLYQDMFGLTKTTNSTSQNNGSTHNDSRKHQDNHTVNRDKDNTSYMEVVRNNTRQPRPEGSPIATTNKLSTEPAHMKTYTFSIPKSSLFKVSSTQLKSILEYPDDLSAASAFPSVNPETFTSGGATAVNHERERHGFRIDMTTSNTSGDTYCNEDRTDDKKPSSTRRHEDIINPTSGGLDYSKIWGSISRDVHVRPSRKVTCYKDYLDL